MSFNEASTGRALGGLFLIANSRKAADILQEKYGVSAEIIDARSLVPFNYEPVIESIKKTGRIVVTGDA